MRTKPYPSDLTDARWDLLEPLLPPAQTCGQPHKTDLREVVNAIFYRDRNGCTRRALPRDYPTWRTVFQLLHPLDSRRCLAGAARGLASSNPTGSGAGADP